VRADIREDVRGRGGEGIQSPVRSDLLIWGVESIILIRKEDASESGNQRIRKDRETGAEGGD
jgi:hypothetical protein